ncbi:MAG: ribulose-phosphate 3-epimerase [Clostridia bacterium]|nr:ribulose-phosphate 3-epimerase [Clostridia bacterium]
MIDRYNKNSSEILLCPSILSADFAALGAAVEQVADTADIIHVDVMDGHFVPNLTLGPPVLGAIRKRTSLPLDVHLMVTNPTDLIEAFAQAGADTLVVHAEVCTHLHRAIQQIRALGVTPGVAINPGTPLEALDEILPYIDMVLLMTVNPGFGGQKYIPTMTGKIRRLRQKIDDLGLDIHIQIDGGIGLDNIRENVAAGANMIVVGSACYAKPDPAAALVELRAAAR